MSFFLEHDTGTEPLARLRAKLAGYDGLAGSPRYQLPVLFWLPTTGREQHLRRLLHRTTPTRVPVATAAIDYAATGASPAGPIWHLVHPTYHHTDDQPRHLIELPQPDEPGLTEVRR